ncbi:tRNA synthetase subunit beta [candidate division MSBL1 archaeon SCGC-AAA261D19]|uniref:tRNA synthetase subunit beta n=1 Tax=candidate division MSBL1 archaeon SCGC-AAA261D19 TaxID=1698273 RepID=A0A133V830_9EURY|nr:tRNA synthetase subunit beta [candidate division MSBL1 archaeon SCGC-AAA261D19]
MNLKFSEEIRDRFPDLRVLSAKILGVNVERQSAELEHFKKKAIEETKKKYELEELKDVPTFRTYRDFFWEIGIDPTKTRPAAEALVRRVLQGKPLPTINTLVDAYNFASLRSEIPLAAFDYQSIKGEPLMRFASEGEEFSGIGMKKPAELNGGEIVVADSEKLIAIYPYRDSDETKITLDTNIVLLMICGVPGVEEEILNGAKRTAIDYVTRFCGGEVEE